MVKVVWFSRHPIIPKQTAELKRLFGNDAEIVTDPNPFSTADAVAKRFKESGAEEMVIVAPLSVVDALCKRGIRPLWPVMEQVPVEEADVIANGRGFRFVEFKRVKRLVLEFEDV